MARGLLLTSSFSESGLHREPRACDLRTRVSASQVCGSCQCATYLVHSTACRKCANASIRSELCDPDCQAHSSIPHHYLLRLIHWRLLLCINRLVLGHALIFRFVLQVLGSLLQRLLFRCPVRLPIGCDARPTLLAMITMCAVTCREVKSVVFDEPH